LTTPYVTERLDLHGFVPGTSSSALVQYLQERTASLGIILLRNEDQVIEFGDGMVPSNHISLV
jgi:hypothetical protein